MMKILKKILIILVLFLTTFYTLSEVKAKTEVSYVDVVEEVDKYEEPTGPQPVFHEITTDSSTTSYSCAHQRTLWDQAEDIISVYNKDNVDIIEQGFIMNEKPLAGTAVGLTIKERRYGKINLKGITVQKSSTTTEMKTKYSTTTQYICKYITPPVKPIHGSMAELHPDDYPQCDAKDKIVAKKEDCSKDMPYYCAVGKVTETSSTSSEQYPVITTSERTYTFDFTSGQTQLTADDVVDAKVIKKCLDEKAAYIANAGNWSVYSKASYDVSLSNSNDANATTEQVVLTNNRANATKRYYDLNGNEISCGTDGCQFKYEESTRVGNTIYAGRYYVLNSDSVIDSNPYLAYLITYFYYGKDKTCLNVKTGEASYVPSSTSTSKTKCNSGIEFEIPNETAIVNDVITLKDGKVVTINNIEETHWHYFIPLNTKSIDGIKLAYQDKYSSGRSLAACENALKTYYIRNDGLPTGNYKYPEVIRPKASGEKFIGDYYCLDKCGTDDAIFTSEIESTDLARIKNEGGCYSSGEHSIETKQLFYNENSTTDSGGNSTIKFNGFNFYYRPIDVTNVFPNGIAASSLWTEWGSDPDPTLDIGESYSIATYVAHDISAKEVRDYNENNPYTSWDKMNTTGTSQYIDTAGVITRTSDYKADLIYKLGCGPANKYQYLKNPDGTNKLDASHHPIPNPLYQKECAK